MDLTAFLEEFKLEAFEHLEKLGSGLLALERTPDDGELIRKLFLSAHTIKGGASMLELRALKTLTHAFEDVLSQLREGQGADAETITLLLRVTDDIKQLVEHTPTLETPSTDTQRLIEALQARARGESPARARGEVSIPANPEPRPTDRSPESLHAGILEPSDTARLLMKLQLEALGWIVTECASRQALCESAQRLALVVVPLEPPGGVDGLDIARELRATHPALQIALSVLECPEQQRLEAERLGVRVVPLTAWNENPFWGAA